MSCFLTSINHQRLISGTSLVSFPATIYWMSCRRLSSIVSKAIKQQRSARVLVVRLVCNRTLLAVTSGGRKICPNLFPARYSTVSFIGASAAEVGNELLMSSHQFRISHINLFLNLLRSHLNQMKVFSREKIIYIYDLCGCNWVFKIVSWVFSRLERQCNLY